MGDVDKLQEAEEFLAQKAEEVQKDKQKQLEAEIEEPPVEQTAKRPRRSEKIALSRLHAKDNIRLDLPHVHELMMSIKERGLVQALTVRPDGDDYTLVAGHRRLAALKQLHQDEDIEIPCEVIEEVDEAEIFALMLVENEQREPLEPLQAARAARHILDLRPEMTAAQLTKSLGLKPGWLSQRFALLELPQDVQDSLERHDLSFTVANILRKAQKAGRIDAAEASEMAAKVVSGQMSSKQVKEATRPEHATVAPKTIKVDEDGNEIIDAAPVEKTAPNYVMPANKLIARQNTEDWASQAADQLLSHDEQPIPETYFTDQVPSHIADTSERVYATHAPDLAAAPSPLKSRLTQYALARALEEWASDEQLAEMHVDRSDIQSYVKKLSEQEVEIQFWGLVAKLAIS